MAARIVYEGAARGSGDLFQGKKFWLSHRIPMRNYWKEQLESNGGTVVQLEINADMIIVDHARKDCPPGSISWTWIEYSLRNGILEDIEGHRAGPAQAQVREVGSTQPTKKTRTKFSPEDDRILMEWVTRAERKGSSILGNIIYQQLAQKYPHHTWQSWLDRWKRYVSTKKRPKLPEDDEDEDEDDVEPALVAPKPKQPRKLPSISRRDRRPVRISVSPPPKSRPKSHIELPNESSIVSPVPSARSQNSSTSLQANPFLLKSTGGNVFTNEETQLLFDAYDAVIDLSDDQVIDAWIAWSAANPTHTPQEWRNHFKEYVAPTQLARINSAKSARQSKEMPPPKFNPARNATSNSNQAPEIKDSQGSSGQTVPTPAKGVDNSTSFTRDSREFAKNLWTLADSLDLEVDPKPVIREKAIKLFDLWRIVTSNEFGGFDEVTGRRKWSRVAERLGFEVIQQKEAGKDLQACYSEILCDLEQAERELQDGDDITSEQEAELIADQLRQTAEQPDSDHGEEEEFSHDQEEEQLLVAEEEHERLLREQEENDDDLNHIQISPRRPQPPSPSAGKRRSGSDRRSSDLPNTKRQRIDKGKGKEQLEIPSTPEDVINNTQISRPPHQPSPLKFGQAEPSSPSTDSLMEEVRPIKLERKRSAAAQQLEPETQDFYHPAPAYPPRPQEGDIEDDDEVILGSYREPQGDQSDGEDEEESSFVKPGPPHSQGRGSQRNSSNATTRGTLHSSNNVSNAATRGTINSSSTNYESSTQSQTESQTGALLEAFITKHVSDGYAQDVVIEALESTSMSLKETLAVMESLANGEGIPEDMPGVWTSWDDEALRAGRGTEDYDRVVRKHGISRISERKKYWRDYLATED